MMTTLITCLERQLEKKETFHFLHIGKCGGTSLIATGLFGHLNNPRVLELWKRNPIFRFRHRLLLKNHYKYVSHDKVPHTFSNKENLFFFIRDPFDRFRSSFEFEKTANTSLYPDTIPESVKNQFANFENFYEWLNAFSKKSSSKHLAAVRLKSESYHLHRDYSFYFKSCENIELHASKIKFIGQQENYEEDLRRFALKFSVQRLLNPVEHFNKTPLRKAMAEEENYRILFAKTFTSEIAIHKKLLQLAETP